MWKSALAGLCLLTSSTASAEWHQASSDHFVIYADDSEKDLRAFAELLERYHAAMADLTSRDPQKPSPSNRVTIFAVGSQHDIKKLTGDRSGTIAGFYLPRAGASTAFVPDVQPKGRNPDWTLIVLLHEYAHHFLISSTRFGMPRWMSEGSAEFYASASFEPDGSIKIGRPALHRATELAYATDVSIRELLDEDTYQAKKRTRYDAFYGRSWLLFHYLTFEQSRRDQLFQYWRYLTRGEPSLASAQAAFGDLDQLEKELDKYLRSRKLLTFVIGADRLPTGPIAVTKLTPGLAEMMPVMIRSQRGVTEAEAVELVVDARKIASEHPGDAMVQAALAEAEFDSGNSQAAIEAADRAIAADPRIANAYIQKGYALFDLAADAEDQDKAYREAMQPFTQLNKLENDHPLPLIYYYRSFAERGMEPNEVARHAIERAAELAPFDKGLWMTVGHMQAQEGKIALAISSLATVANDPHEGELTRAAQAYIDALRDAPEGESFDLSSVVIPSTEEAAVPEAGG